MTALRRIYELFPPRMRERIKLVLGAHGHGRSGLDGLKARDHARGKKRLDRVALALASTMRDAGVTSLRGLSCLEFGAGYVPSEVLVFHLLGARRVMATDYNAIAQLPQLAVAARAANRADTLAILAPFADGVDIEQRLDEILKGDTKNFIAYAAPHDMSTAPILPAFDFIHSVSVFEHLPVPRVPPILDNLARSLAAGGRMISEIDLRDHRDLDNAPLAFLAPGNDYDPVRDADLRGNRLMRGEWLALFGAQPDLATRPIYEKNMERRFLPAGFSGNGDDALVSWLGLLSVRT